MTRHDEAFHTVAFQTADRDAAKDCTAEFFAPYNAGTEYDHRRYSMEQLVDRILWDVRRMEAMR